MQCRFGPFSSGETGGGCAPYVMDDDRMVGQDPAQEVFGVKVMAVPSPLAPCTKPLALPRGHHG